MHSPTPMNAMMTIGIAQIDCRVGDVGANLQTITAAIERAAGEGCRLVVLPEMSDTGYEMAAIRSTAAAWGNERDPGGSEHNPIAVIRECAARHHTAVICGLSERVGDTVYNSAAIIDRGGNLAGRYRKSHRFSLAPVCEDKHLGQGNELTLVQLDGIAIGVMICYDLRFPELARALALDGAQLVVVMAAWPECRIEHWKLLNQARAVENQLYVAAANRVGTDGPLVFGGSSSLWDPLGRAVAAADCAEESLIVGRMSVSLLDEVRGAMSVFADRRPELYGPVSESVRGRSRA